MSSNLQSFLTLRIGEHWCGISVNQIIEVFYMMAFKAVPTEQKDVLGFITVRNQLMPLIDMRLRFDSCAAAIRMDSPIVALSAKAGPIAIVVDDTDTVTEVESSAIQLLNGNGQIPNIGAVTKLCDKVLLILDIDMVSQEFYGVIPS